MLPMCILAEVPVCWPCVCACVVHACVPAVLSRVYGFVKCAIPVRALYSGAKSCGAKPPSSAYLQRLANTSGTTVSPYFSIPIETELLIETNVGGQFSHLDVQPTDKDHAC